MRRSLCSGCGAGALAVAALIAATHRSMPPDPFVDPIDRPNGPVLFNRDIRPILSNKCFKCHGPDSAARQAGLRLDNRKGATAELDDGVIAIVPGDPAASELIARITHEDESERMPPLESRKTLTEQEIALLRRWIEQGAPWQDHWSFIAPEKPQRPSVSDESWPINPIDAFVLARLDSKGLNPSARASRETLIRRVSLDLTGLPPALDEIDAFLSDARPDACERVVDRLLASPRYGEHVARYWLDAARYGDTHGLHLDNERTMWPWRDWVINAFNANMPFDRFTIEQLAGDLLPDPTNEQMIATGFNRNHVTTSEGGAIDAEYLVKYAADRTETTATVWMGLTVGCAQCHDHKFDPISQKEYYQLFAFFNNITEKAMDGNQRDPPPVVRVPTPEQEAPLADLRAGITDRESVLDAPNAQIDAAQREWRDHVDDLWKRQWTLLDPVEYRSTNGAALRRLDDGSLLAEGENPDRDVYEIVARTNVTGLRMLRLEALTHQNLPHAGPGRAENANFVLSEIEAEIISGADPTRREPIHFVAAVADHEQLNGPFLATHAIDGVIDDTNGWAVEGFDRRENRTAVFVSESPFGFEGGSEIHVRLRFETHFKQHAIGRVRLSVTGNEELRTIVAPSGYSPWSVVGPFTADSNAKAYADVFGPEHAPGQIDLTASYGSDALEWILRPEFLDGEIQTLEGEMCATYLYRTIHVPTSRDLVMSIGSDDAIKIWLNGRIVHENDVARGVAPDQDRVTISVREGENHLLMKVVNFSGAYGFYFKPLDDSGGAEFLRVADLITAQEIDDEQATRLRRYFRRRHSPRMRAVYDELAVLRARETEMVAGLPTTLVMQERDDRRHTFLLFRGEYDKPRDPVEPGVPAALPGLPGDVPHDRLGLARWLVHARHPLTARVTINRMWQQVFGVGIVRTAGDFGSQGEWPSHPDLLDWLAVEFIDSGWDVKHMMRLLVTSATYRQSSAAGAVLSARDPDNRLLARGPRFRMDAEQIRDLALASSGLLVEKLGGPSVKPYQPVGQWKAVAYPDSNTRIFEADEGDAQHRRSLYTFWKRTSPPPSMTAFDAPSRETCTVRRPRTNTPLQSLVLLNDPQYVEAARALAQRAMLLGDDPKQRISIAFRILTARAPGVEESNILLALYNEHLAVYRADPESAVALLAIGGSLRDESLDPVEHAAMTNVIATILSLDETITKG